MILHVNKQPASSGFRLPVHLRGCIWYHWIRKKKENYIDIFTRPNMSFQGPELLPKESKVCVVILHVKTGLYELALHWAVFLHTMVSKSSSWDIWLYSVCSLHSLINCEHLFPCPNSRPNSSAQNMKKDHCLIKLEPNSLVSLVELWTPLMKVLDWSNI